MSTKDAVLAALMNAKGEVISGAKLAEKLGVSRTAIWNCMEQLKAEGCQFEASPRTGYRLIQPPDVICLTYLKQRLAGSVFENHIYSYGEVDSTNNLAKEMALKGAPTGTVVIADRQSGGRGRLGKKFYSPRGGLYFTAVLRPDLPMSDMMAVTAAAAAAVHEALMEFGIATKIKWVNDLFLGGKKICGILTEGSFNAELRTLDFLVIGIGLNLRTDPKLPAELIPILTDLHSETGKIFNKSDVLAVILRHLEKMIAELPKHTFLPVYTNNSCTLGHHVQVQSNGQDKTGVAIRFTEDAGLVVRYEDGAEEIIRSGSAIVLD
jgi:BirA family biotin operon repressor/biotin-[acetyl-CoA-carboxylase] ligase